VVEPGPAHLGGLVADQPVVIRDADLVVYVTNIRAFPTGFLFTVVVEQRASGSLYGQEPEIEVDFSDGVQWRRDLDMRGNCLHQRGSESSGGPRGSSWRGEFWLPALPVAGPVTFKISVGDRIGLASLDGKVVIESAERAVDLWD
jgi:hypothetical protein